MVLTGGCPVGSYKPSLANFNYSIDHIKSELGVDKDEILVTANSKLHDIKPYALCHY